MVRTLPYGSENRPQAARIFGIAATIALHVLAAMLLLIPMTAPRGKVDVETVVKPRWIIPEIVPITPIPTSQPDPQRKNPTKPETSTPVAPVTPTATADNAPFVEATPATVDPQPTTNDTTTVVEPPSGPVALSSLAYLSATPPPYPSSEARAGVEGTVTLRILVGSDGVPLEVSIERSSGNRNLDKAALRHVKDKWRFQPAVRDGHAVQAYGLVPIAFSLQ